MALGDILGIGSLISGIVNGRAQRKLDEKGLNLQQNQLYEQSQQDRARLGIDQQKAEQGAQSDAYRKAVLSALGMNMQDVSYSPDGGFMGGLRPSAFGAEGKAAAKALNPLAMGQLTTPQPRPELEPYQRIKIGDQQPYAYKTKLPVMSPPKA